MNVNCRETSRETDSKGNGEDEAEEGKGGSNQGKNSRQEKPGKELVDGKKKIKVKENIYVFIHKF